MATKIVHICDVCKKSEGVKTFYMDRGGAITSDPSCQYTEEMKEIDLCDSCVCKFIAQGLEALAKSD